MDEATVNRAMDLYAAGDAQAFAVIHQALRPRLFAFLLRMTGSNATAADLVQETFLRMHRARSTFATGGAVLPWAYAIARNVALDHARGSRLRATERLPSDPGSEVIDPNGANGEAQAIASEAAGIVGDVLAKLPQNQRDAFILLRYEGLSVNDAAAVLGATPTAVKLRAFRAYEALRAALGRDSPNAPSDASSDGRDRPRAETDRAGRRLTKEEAP